MKRLYFGYMAMVLPTVAGGEQQPGVTAKVHRSSSARFPACGGTVGRCAFWTLLLLLVLANKAEASHFRYGNISWRVVGSDASKRTIEFKISQAWRGTPALGESPYGSTLDFGDNTTQDFAVAATAVNATDNYYYGQATLTHTYAANGDYTVSAGGCCRIPTLVNNASGAYNITSVVNVGTGNSSPVSTLSPIVNLPEGTTSTSFQVPANDPDNDPLTYSLATSTDMGGIAFTNPSGLAINGATGLVTLNTTDKAVGQLYNAALKISDGKTIILLDFLIEITPKSAAPKFDYSVTPANGSVYQIPPGRTVSFGVKATDDDAGDVVTLRGIGLPSGSTMAPALPTSGNPVQSSFSWTPDMNSLGTNVINFVAQDKNGAQTYSSVTVQVSLRPTFDVPPSPLNGSTAQFAPGAAVRYTIQASAPDPNDRVRLVAAQHLPAGAALTAPLPTAAGNPTSTQLAWTPVIANWGMHTVLFTAANTHGEATDHSFNIVVNTPPTVVSAPVTTAIIGRLYSYSIKVNDPDVPYGDSLHIVATTKPAWLSLKDNGNGTATLSGTPQAGDAGGHNVVLVAEDTYHHGYDQTIAKQAFAIQVVACNTSLAATGTNPSCFGSRNGAIALAVSGGTAPFTYSWTGPSNFTATSKDVAALAAGTYTVTVADANQCGASAQVTLTQPAPVAAPTIAVVPDNNVYTGGTSTTLYLGYGPQSATLTASGSVSYSWSPAAGLSSSTVAEPVFTASAPGTYTYTVTATSQSGCTATQRVTLTVVEARCGGGGNNQKVLVCHNGHEICISVNAVPAHIGNPSHDDYLGSCHSAPVACSATPITDSAVAGDGSTVFDISPNPFSASTAVHFRLPQQGPVQLRVYDSQGAPVATLYEGVAAGGRDYSLSLNAQHLNTGIYFCQLVANGKTENQRIVLTR